MKGFWYRFLVLIVLLSMFRQVPVMVESRKQKVAKDRVLEKKYYTLTKLVSEDGLVEDLRLKDFQQYFVQQPRNYSGFVLFNTLLDQGCRECVQAQKIFRFVSSSYMKGLGRLESKYQPPSAFFLEILEEDEPEILRLVGVGSFNLPTIFYVPPNGWLEELEEMNLDQYSIKNVESVMLWIWKVSNIRIQPHQHEEEETFWELNFTKILAVALMICNILKYRTVILYLILNRTSSFLGCVAIIGVCYFTSGHKFNQIRQMPLLTESPNGYQFIYPSSNLQLGFESLFIMIIYCSMTGAFITLIEFQKEKETKNKWIGLASFLIFLAGFNMLHKIYSWKFSN